MSTIVRIAAWSGPRNISTAMMRSFENRPDTAVIDEPFYAAWLAWSGADHPLRAEVLASQPTDWRRVVHTLLGAIPGDRAIFYQKHMTHHVTPDMDLSWMAGCRNVFLIRAPEDVVASYWTRRPEVVLDDIGVVQQAELFDREADRLGAPPPVVDAADILADPKGVLSALCAAVDIDFDPAMLSWPSGPRDTDGVWASAWYEAVWRSTGFGRPREKTPVESLGSHLRLLAEAARPSYERLAAHRLGGPAISVSAPP
jgi:hypothetical protein